MGLAVVLDSPAAVVVRKTRVAVERKDRWICTFVKMDFGIKNESSMGTTEGALPAEIGGAEAISEIKLTVQWNGNSQTLSLLG